MYEARYYGQNVPTIWLPCPGPDPDLFRKESSDRNVQYAARDAAARIRGVAWLKSSQSLQNADVGNVQSLSAGDLECDIDLMPTMQHVKPGPYVPSSPLTYTAGSWVVGSIYLHTGYRTGIDCLGSCASKL